jgi:cytochrome c peroxidase
MNHRPLLAALLASATLALAGCPEDNAPTQGSAKPAGSAAAAPTVTATAKPLPPMPKAPPIPATPEGLPELKTPADNPLTPEKVMLGKQLFFDKRLSKDGSASCETCHVPEKGWTDGKPLSQKVGGGMNTRHSPTLINVGYNELWYWDGRAETLEKQIEAAWKGQMGADPAAIAAALKKVPLYEVEFKAVFNSDPTPDTILKALASFVRTIRSGGSPWDKHEKGDKTAASDAAKRGWELFRNKAGCAACHAPPAYTDNGFHNTGIGFDKPEPDLGRGKIAKDEKLDGAFKTPTLRSVTKHPPYFHDGRSATIEEAVDYMLSGGIKDKNKHLDDRMKPVKLSPKEREDLLAFVKALEAPEEPYERPTIPTE